jgi:hypothetical protein
MGYWLADHPNDAFPQYVNPRRGGNKLSGTVIMHTAEGYGAINVAWFISGRSDWGSYHRLVDETVRIPMAHWEWETWQDSETNNWAVGISAAINAADWLKLVPNTRERIYRNLAIEAADFVQYMRAEYGIEVPRRRLTGAEARARVPGFCAHGDSGISRTDPGKDFEWDRFFRYIDEILAGTQESEDDMTPGELLNSKAFDPTEEFPNPPTFSEAIKDLYYAFFNPLKNNESIIGGETLPGLVNENDKKILAELKALNERLDKFE